jgi:hypothetical protein
VGLLARGIEKLGLPTVYVGLMLDIMQIIRPPRAAFLNFPLGHPIGKPFQPNLQLAILKDILSLLETAREPETLVHLPFVWGEPFTFVPGSRR